MSIEFIGFTFSFVGKILIAYTVLTVHYRVWKERKLDEVVLTTMHLEQKFALIGIVLLIIGYLLQAPFKL